LKLWKPPAKDVGTRAPFAAAYADVLPESHRDALRDAAITYLDDCFSTIADGEPGQSYADTPIGSYIPSRYEQYYDGRFARPRSGGERPLLQRRARRRPSRQDREAALVALTRRDPRRIDAVAAAPAEAARVRSHPSTSPYGRMRMIVFPVTRSVGLRVATASWRVATLQSGPSPRLPSSSASLRRVLAF
jgi:hypothetical protein